MNDWLAERILLGEVPASRQAEVSALDAQASAQLALLRESNEQILAALPPERVAAEVRRRFQATQVRAPRRWVMWVAPVAVAAAVLMILVMRGGTPGQTVSEFGERSKGDARLEFHQRVGNGSVKIRPGAVVEQGDQVQLSYIAAGQRYGVIVSIDGRGAVTVHHPMEGAEAAPLEAGGAIALRYAYELDDAPLYERFFFVTSRAPFERDVVVDAARQLTFDLRRADSARLALPSGLFQTSYLFRKPGASP